MTTFLEMAPKVTDEELLVGMGKANIEVFESTSFLANVEVVSFFITSSINPDSFGILNS